MNGRIAARARAVVLLPSIENGPAFAEVVEDSLPPSLTFAIGVDIQAGVVEAVRVPEQPLAWLDCQAWMADLQAWLQLRAPADWWGSLTAGIRSVRVASVAIRRVLLRECA